VHDGGVTLLVLAEVDPDEVRPGVLGLVVVLALVVATALLLRSFVKQLRKVDFDEDPDPAAGSDPAAGLDPAPGNHDPDR